MRQALIIAGPTCSGKSALALALAERLGGTVINADAMQCYRELRVLTARPTPEEEARIPHALYGVLPAAVAGSVAWWRDAALEAMERARLPILCGGTGMYLRALTQGLSALPDVTPAAREQARTLLAELGPEALHARLNAEDAAAIRPSDSQRIARAHEVWLSTGRSLAHWQRAAPLLPPAPYAFRAILLDPPREALRAAIAARWEAMLAGGAREEVAALLAQGLDPALPAMRAHGVPELAALLRGEMTEAEASRRAIANTSAYTRRQATWFRHQPLVAPRSVSSAAPRHVPSAAPRHVPSAAPRQGSFAAPRQGSFAAPRQAHIINARFASLAQFSESELAKIFAFLREGVDGAVPPP